MDRALRKLRNLKKRKKEKKKKKTLESCLFDCMSVPDSVSMYTFGNKFLNLCIFMITHFCILPQNFPFLSHLLMNAFSFTWT